MEDELWKALYQMAKDIDNQYRPRTGTFWDMSIVLTYLWSVLHDRPVCWACDQKNWPICYRRQRRPSPSTMSRRLRSDSVQAFLRRLENTCIQSQAPSLCRWIDAKPLPIGGSSQDSQAGYGRAASCKAKGYKLYAIADKNQGFVTWAVWPMQYNESTVANGLIVQLDSEGYLAGDRAYDCNRLYDLAGARSVQLVAPRRYHSAKGLGHHYHSPYRLYALELLDKPLGRSLLNSRDEIERMFGQLGNFGCGLGPLPNWVRTLFRVRLWVRGKMIFHQLWRRKQRQSVA